MHFASDNWGGALPEVAQALVDHCDGFAAAYGNSELDRSLVHRFQEIFEHDLEMFLVGTGTAANSLAMSAAGRPGGVVFSHANAHMFEEECGAIEKIGGGLRITPVEGALGKIAPEKFAAALGRLPEGFVHVGQPSAVTLTQATEWGTLYQLDQIAEIASIARKRNIAVHMDGARFANARRSRCHTRRHDMEAGRRHALLRCEQEWLLVRRSAPRIQSSVCGTYDLCTKAGRASVLKVPLHLCPARNLSFRRQLAEVGEAG
ncbi:beta-eliminating lyase-related protein [Caballeronia sp. CLC5]|nr:beta-eliminating lyase-related protein [Caballeronia sp. CLC5]MCE4568655.1 beta-eliminating lyase-related protein [Caballeronia sp. CLC5]